MDSERVSDDVLMAGFAHRASGSCRTVGAARGWLLSLHERSCGGLPDASGGHVGALSSRS